MVKSPNKSKLNQVLSHSKWKSGGKGMKVFTVHKKMNIPHSYIATNIAFKFSWSPRTSAAQMLAMLSLTATITFITQLLGMVDAMYKRLVVVSIFSFEQQAWSLTTQVLNRVCLICMPPRRKALLSR